MARIIVANDDPDLLAVCQYILEGDGHAVETVANGKLLLALVRACAPDLVVLDWVMPEIDGGQATEALRADSATAALPILMMSGSFDADQRARSAGADAFLRKPFEAGELIAGVDQLLARTAPGASAKPAAPGG